MFDIAGALGEVGDFGGGAGELDDLSGEVVDGHAVAVADVVSAVEVGAAGDVGEGGDDVGDVDEIAGLLAIAEDREVGACEGLLDEDGDGGGVGAFGVLARAEDVEEAQGGGVEFALAAEEFEVVFAIEFGDGIGAHGLREHGLDFWDGGVVAVDGGGAGEYDLAHSGGGGGFEDVE